MIVLYCPISWKFQEELMATTRFPLSVLFLERFIPMLLRWGVAYIASRYISYESFSKENMRFRFLTSFELSLVFCLIRYLYFGLYDNFSGSVLDRSVLCSILGASFVFRILMVERYFKVTQQLQESQRMEILTQRNYETQEKNGIIMENVRIMHHDMKKYIDILRSSLDESSDIQKDLTELQNRLHKFETIVETGNGVLNYLLNTKILEAAQYEIRMSANIDFLKGDFVHPLDICTIFGNVIDNAIEAVQLLEKDRRIIQIKGCSVEDMFLFRIKNYYSNSIEIKNNQLVSNKENGEMRGLGLKAIRAALVKYDGILNLDYENSDTFTVNIAIPLKEAST